jgi:hypothetical protein
MSHITDEQVDAARREMRRRCCPVLFTDMRAALEAAFPEPPSPAVFGKLVVTEEMAEEVRISFFLGPRDAMRKALQSFVDRHAIKPIAFAERMPVNGSDVWIWSVSGDVRGRTSPCWFYYGIWRNVNPLYSHTHWLPASALPIPEPPVDPKEQAWRGFKDDFPGISCDVVKANFEAVWEAAQREGK